MSLKYLSDTIKAEAKNLGFFSCGICQAKPVDNETANHLQQWINSNSYGNMHYMARNIDKRCNPQLLMDNAKSIVSVAMNYCPSLHFDTHQYQIAAYALGKDYHDLMKTRLHQLAQKIGVQNYRVFCDTAPILDRYWAQQCGVGFIGKNHQLIIPHAGSMFFLGELLLDIPLAYDTPMPNRCGNCHQCIDACPTQALKLDKEIDAERCLSYQTIENRGELSQLAKRKKGNSIYGCDRCQQACPYNRFAQPTTEPWFTANPQLMQMSKTDWHQLTQEQYQKLFKGSAVKRAKYEGLMRNIKG